MQGQGCPQTPYTGQFADETEEEDTAVSVVVCQFQGFAVRRTGS